jgi:NodT family efflux transporter outer membrane factor (OMF) lipoprotein
LIERALASGLDVREAFARLREARARRGVAAGERFPTIEAGASYRRSRESERTALGALSRESDHYAVGLDAAWEIDLWGRIRRVVEAADAELAASVEDTHDVARLLAAETAFVYVELRAFQHRVALARTNVDLQQQTLELVAARFDAGLVGERDLAQAATNVAVTRSRVPAFEAGRRAAENRLSVLLGVAPGSLADELDPARPIPVPPGKAVLQMPAELIRKRPDVRRAERIAAAEHARIGVATAELYPRFALSGSLSVSAEDASDLFRSGSDGFGIGPSLRWNLFDRGRLRRQVEVQDARAEQALIRWERTVLTAVEETENAMTGFVRGQSRRESLLEAAAQARRAVELAQFEYNEGLSDFQAVLDSQRALAQLDDELAQTDAGIATQFIALQKALGG